jgi:hypothetical protein
MSKLKKQEKKFFDSLKQNKKKKKMNNNCACGPNCKCGINCKCENKENAMQKAIRQHNRKQHPENCVVDDDVCEQTLQIFQKFDKNAIILPQIGFPSKAKGVCTISHQMPGGPKLKINGLESNSALANNALFSTECVDNKFLNLYETMLPDVNSNTQGNTSSVEDYVENLSKEGLNAAGVHFHWFGTSPASVVAVHHQNVGMNPIEFANKTIQALNAYNQFH